MQILVFKNVTLINIACSFMKQFVTPANLLLFYTKPQLVYNWSFRRFQCILFLFVFFTLKSGYGCSQSSDTANYIFTIDTVQDENSFFTKNPFWRGADGAASADLGNGKVLWLFSDSFINSDSSLSRRKSTLVRNSIAIQDGYNLNTASLKFYWNRAKKKPRAFFSLPGKFWYWTGHAVRLKDRLLVFLIKEREAKDGLGFEAFGWSVVLITNPDDCPSVWKMKYIEAPETFGTIAGSAAVLRDDNYLYTYGTVEPATHEVYILRWNLVQAYKGHLSNPQWWINGKWAERKSKFPIPEPLFIGTTEYSVHYDSLLKKFIQVQSFGFGEAKIGLRMADQLTGPWTEPYIFYTPVYSDIKKPLMYSAKAHPELAGDWLYITYNINSADMEELLENQTIYFPKIIRIKITKKIK